MDNNWLQNIIYAGHFDESSSDIRKQFLISSLFSLISVVLLVIFGIDGLRSGNNLLAAIVLGFAIINGANYIFLRWTANYHISSIVIVVLMMILCLYLLCSGGNDNTGPLWYFILPSLIFYILGLKRGLIMLTILLGITAYILFIPDNFLLQTEYSTAFVHRFAGALFSVSAIAYAYEYTREDGRKELLSLSQKLDKLSRRDELTGLANRRDILEQLQNELSRFERSGHTFSVLIADIDYFKLVNDTYGHEYGDYVLNQVAVTFSKNTQKRDKVARWGGEEFLIFLPETTGEQGKKTAERLRSAIEKLTIIHNNKLTTITTSIGVAEYQSDQSLNELIHIADSYLYQAKKEGRNRVMGATVSA